MLETIQKAGAKAARRLRQRGDHYLIHNAVSCHYWFLAASITFLLSTVSNSVYAFVVEKFSPQGDVARVRQVVMRFNEAMVRFGDPALPAPVTVDCAEPGRGRWVNEREWIYDFERDVPIATRCRFTLKADLKALAGSGNTGTAQFMFSTGGPAVVRTLPWRDSTIDEQQVFVIETNGPVDAASLPQNVSCASDKLGEAMPMVLVPDKERRDVLDTLKGRVSRIPADRLVVMRCQRPLPEGANVTLTWGKGVQSPNKVKALETQRFGFRVRPAFRVSFTCEREQADRPCIALAPMSLNFSAPVPAKLAMAVELRGGGKTLKPLSDREGEPAESDALSGIQFAAPFAESTEFSIVLPKGFADDSGRVPANAQSFPLKVATGPLPPLAKFSARFGIVEREGNGAPGSLPVTVRNIEAQIKGSNAQLGARSMATRDDREVVRWLRHARFDSDYEFVTRAVSHLKNEKAATVLPAIKTQRATEVIGIPLAEPGLHAVEIESQALGDALLRASNDANAGSNKPAPSMFVRSLALHTGMAVHFKTSTENAAVWVTSLSTGKPVGDADVRISDCLGKELWRGKTQADGTVRINQSLKKVRCDLDARERATLLPASSRDERYSSGSIEPFLIATARTADDYSFALSNWTQGIEPWRFNLRGRYDYGYDGGDGEGLPQGFVAHTVLDRSLLRTGETVHMKHLLRNETLTGLSRLQAAAGYSNVEIRHLGSDQTFTAPLKWLNNSSATSEWKIPDTAKLGIYTISLIRTAEAGAARSWPAQLQTGSFQVAQFRLPVMQGAVSSKARPLVAVKEVPLSLQLNYLNGGAAAGENVTLSALLRPSRPSFNGYDEFRFDLPSWELDEEMRNKLGLPEQRDQLVADKIAATLDKQGSASVTVPVGNAIKQPANLRTEMNYRDPTGEIQSIASNIALWPAAVVLGVKDDDWFGESAKRKLQFVVLDITGKALAGTRVSVQGIARKSFSVRKRTVGGFYTYDNRVETNDLGTVCEGASDERGRVFCELDSRKHQGNMVLIGRAVDANGNTAYAGTSVWLGRSDYFAAENADRMDVLPLKPQLEPGESAKLQVRMPFYRATAWVSVEREGVIDTFTVDLSRDKPEITVPIKPEYTPNVFISVLAVRPRIREAPWWSFFTWGWRSPREWWDSFKTWDKPTAMVDLAKPAYRLGIAELQVGRSAQTLKVNVKTEQRTYQTRAQVRCNVQLLQPDGKPVAAGSSVAIAVVDEALLELKPNDSWELLQAMWRRRSYGVETATAQMQVIGKRHFGLKAQPAGGGGGRSPTRELLDTLVYWNPNAIAGANGEVPLNFTLNDALTKFRVVAIADADDGWFGTGSASIVATKDLQIIAGLAPLVRDADQFAAMVTLRNTTQRAMKVNFTAQREDAAQLPPFKQTVDLAAGSSQVLSWPVKVDESANELRWKLDAVDTGNPSANDSLRSVQRVVPAVPVTTWQATLMQIEQPLNMEVQAPAGALAGRGGLQADLRASLVGSLAPVRRWFAQYPYSCLEQRTSRAIGMRDEKLWSALGESLPNYLDSDGLARYFPDDLPGSDVLTAYLLAASHEAGWLLPQASLDRMTQALANFAEGRIKREFWAPRKDLDQRKLAAVEALARYGKAKPAMLASINITPQNWPTSAVIDWYSVLQRMSDAPDRDKRLAEALQILRARLDLRGTKLAFSDERGDYWWWLMTNSDANAARLLLAAMNSQPGTSGIAEWLQDMPRLVNGLIARQSKGAWMTTTANVWGSLAVEKYASNFERDTVTGTTSVSIKDNQKALFTQQSTWQSTGVKDNASTSARPATVTLPWASGAATLNITHQGAGKPYVMLQSLAAVPMTREDFAGYRVTRTVTPVTQKTPGKWSVGDVYRVKIDVDAQADMSWVVLSDPVPAGATVLGSGLARDSQVEVRGERATGGWAAFEERTFEGFRVYYHYLSKGTSSVEYTVRLNQPGDFALPPTRAEAMYAPDMYGALPNARMKVE